MTSDVEIIIAQNEKSLLVPNQAIRTDSSGKQVIYLVTDTGEVKVVSIQIGASSDTHSEILAGEVKAGDRIQLNPSDASNNAPGFMLGGGLRGDGPDPHEAFGGQP